MARNEATTGFSVAPYSPLMRGGAVVLASRGLGLALGLVVNIVLARSLDVEEFGTFVLGLTLLQFVLIVPDGGLGALLVREASRDPGAEQRLLHSARALKLLATVPVSIVVALASLLFVSGDQPRIAVVCLVGVAPITSLTLGLNLLQSRQRFSALAAFVLVQSLIWCGIALLIAAFHGSLVDFAVGFLAANLLFALITHSWFRRDRRARGKADRSLRKLVVGAASLGLAAVAVQAYARVDTILVYQLRGAADAGLYGLAYRIFEQAAIVPLTLSNVFLPLLSRERLRPGERSAVLAPYVRTTLLATVPVVGLGILSAPTVLPLIFGSRYAEASTLLIILLAGFPAVSFGWLFSQFAIVNGRFRSRLAIALLALVFNVAVNLVLIPRHGATGAAASTVATEYLVAFLLFADARRSSRAEMRRGRLVGLRPVVDERLLP